MNMGQFAPDLLMHIRQAMEGHEWVEIVLGVIGHVPHQQPHQRRGQPVAVLGAERVLGEQIEAQEGLAQQLRQHPIQQECLPAEGQHDEQRQGQDEGHHPANTAADVRCRIEVDEGIGGETALQPLDEVADAAGPIGHAQHTQEIAIQDHWYWLL